MRLSQVSEALDLAYEMDRPPLLWGPPGVGKSAIVQQFAERKGVTLLDFRLAEFESVDLRGTPRERNGRTYWAPPEELPTNGSKGILFLDELAQAKGDVKNVARRLVYERRIGNWQLPKGWRIFAASNRMGDAAGTSPMPTHLNNVFWHIDVEASIEDWIKNFAEPKEVDDRVIAYLKYRPEALLAFDPRSKDAAFASPRSWHMLSDLLKAMKGAENKIEAGLLGEHMSGAVGRVHGLEFAAFVRTLMSLVSIEQILLDPRGAQLPREPSVCYALATALAAQVKRDTIEAAFTYTERMSKEFQFVFARKVEKIQPTLQRTKAWTMWAALNADYV